MQLYNAQHHGRWSNFLKPFIQIDTRQLTHHTSHMHNEQITHQDDDDTSNFNVFLWEEILGQHWIRTHDLPTHGFLSGYYLFTGIWIFLFYPFSVIGGQVVTKTTQMFTGNMAQIQYIQLRNLLPGSACETNVWSGFGLWTKCLVGLWLVSDWGADKLVIILRRSKNIPFYFYGLVLSPQQSARA